MIRYHQIFASRKNIIELESFLVNPVKVRNPEEVEKLLTEYVGNANDNEDRYRDFRIVFDGNVLQKLYVESTEDWLYSEEINELWPKIARLTEPDEELKIQINAEFYVPSREEVSLAFSSDGAESRRKSEVFCNPCHEDFCI